MKDNLVIIYIDGGIASQISFIALGKAFEEKGCRVKYDLSWFEQYGVNFYNTTNGYDKNYDVTFDIPKAFPNLSIEIANQEEIRKYKKKYSIDDDRVISMPPPLYIKGYLGRHFSVKYRDIFLQYFSPKECLEQNTPFSKNMQQIQQSKSVGIHIRIGDLGKYHKAYGELETLEYYKKTIDLALHIEPQSTFYLFSDDISWTKEHLTPLLKDKEFKVCDTNNPNQGYLDLFLLSLCDIIIASRGGLGHYAKILSKKNALLISPKLNNLMFDQIGNIIFTNWGKDTKIPSLEKALHSLSSFSIKDRLRLWLYRKLVKKSLIPFI